jgi:hypothetical protein
LNIEPPFRHTVVGGHPIIDSLTYGPRSRVKSKHPRDDEITTIRRPRPTESLEGVVIEYDFG